MAAELNVAKGEKGFVSIPAVARFWAKVKKSDTCWLWTGSKTPRGYGHFWLDGRLQFAHRVSYAMAKGEIPDGLVLDHLCRAPSCVNPEHLEAVTQHENMRRGKKSPNQNALKTHCIRGHALVGDNLMKGKKRRCFECHRMRDLRYRTARSALLLANTGGTENG